MTVRLLTQEQRDMIHGKEYTKDMYFYPIQDNSDNWVISEEEVSQCDNEQYLWVKELEHIDYVPKTIE